MSRIGTGDTHRQESSGGLVQEFMDHWLALCGDAWLAMGGIESVRRAVSEAARTLVPDRGPSSPRRAVAWAAEEFGPLDLPGLLAPQGFEFVGPAGWAGASGAVGDGGLAPTAELADEMGARGATAAERRNLTAVCDLGITTCSWAAADTGTIALYATPSSGRLPSLLPVAHLTLVRPSLIVRSIPDGLRLMADYRVEKGDLPSTVNLVSGPSRTGDIEGDFAVGVHGPMRAGVIIGEW